MKNIILSVFFALLIVACVAKEAKNKKTDSCCESKEASTSECCKTSKAKPSCCSNTSDSTVLTVSIDELIASPEKYVDKNIDLSGLVVHTCKKSGKKMFLVGSDDSVYVKVEAGDKISKFDPSLEGSTVIASGFLSVISVEEHHHEHAEGESCASEGKGKDYILTCEKFKTI